MPTSLRRTDRKLIREGPAAPSDPEGPHSPSTSSSPKPSEKSQRYLAEYYPVAENHHRRKVQRRNWIVRSVAGRWRLTPRSPSSARVSMRKSALDMFLRRFITIGRLAVRWPDGRTKIYEGRPGPGGGGGVAQPRRRVAVAAKSQAVAWGSLYGW